MDLVVRDLYRRFEERLEPQHWDRYVEDYRSRDPRTPDWSAGTLTSLRTRVFGMLTEAGYLSDARTRTLRPLTVAPTVTGYLRAHGRDYALRCLQVDPR